MGLSWHQEGKMNMRVSSHDSKSGGDKFKKFGKAKAASKFKVPAKKTSKSPTVASDGAPMDPAEDETDSQVEDSMAAAAAPPVAESDASDQPVPREKAAVRSSEGREQVASGVVESPSATRPSASAKDGSSSPLVSQDPGPKRKRNDATSPLPAEVLPDARAKSAAVAKKSTETLAKPSAAAKPEVAARVPQGKGRRSPTPSSAPTMKMGSLVRPASATKPPPVAKPPVAKPPVAKPPVAKPSGADAPSPPGAKRKVRSKAGATTMPPPPGYVAPPPPPSPALTPAVAKPMLPPLPKSSSGAAKPGQNGAGLPSPADMVSGRKSGQVTAPPPIPGIAGPVIAAEPVPPPESGIVCASKRAGSLCDDTGHFLRRRGAESPQASSAMHLLVRPPS